MPYYKIKINKLPSNIMTRRMRSIAIRLKMTNEMHYLLYWFHTLPNYFSVNWSVNIQITFLYYSYIFSYKVVFVRWFLSCKILSNMTRLALTCHCWQDLQNTRKYFQNCHLGCGVTADPAKLNQHGSLRVPILKIIKSRIQAWMHFMAYCSVYSRRT